MPETKSTCHPRNQRPQVDILMNYFLFVCIFGCPVTPDPETCSLISSEILTPKNCFPGTSGLFYNCKCISFYGSFQICFGKPQKEAELKKTHRKHKVFHYQEGLREDFKHVLNKTCFIAIVRQTASILSRHERFASLRNDRNIVNWKIIPKKLNVATFQHMWRSCWVFFLTTNKRTFVSY